MKKALSLSFVLIILCGFYFSCRKTSFNADGSNSSLIEDGKQYFEKNVFPYHNPDTTVSVANVRMTLHKAPQWDKAYVDVLSFGKTVIVPLNIKEPLHLKNGNNSVSINDLSYLIIYKDTLQNIHCEVITKIPNAQFIGRHEPLFSGIVYIENWSGSLLSSYSYIDGAVTARLNTTFSKSAPKSATAGISTNAIQSNRAVNPPPVEVCTDTDWYGCDDDGNGSLFDCIYSYTSESCVEEVPGGGTTVGEPGGTSYGFVGSGGTGASGSISYVESMEAFQELAPSNPITNVAGYIKCFDALSGSTYFVSILVDQPVPHSSAAYSVGGSGVPSSSGGGSGSGSGGGAFDVGHTFLEFTEVRPNGSITTRFMGFYPTSVVTPFSASSPGALNNDEGHDANVGLQISVSQTQFSDIMTYMSNGNTATYNLNSNNCTTYALSALEAGGIIILSPTGKWPGGSGDDPGDLGQTLYGSPSFGANTTVGQASLLNPITNVGLNVGTCPN